MSRRNLFLVAALASAALLGVLWQRAHPAATQRSEPPAAPAVRLSPGQIWRDTLRIGARQEPTLGPPLVVVPAGTFWMGTTEPTDTTATEQPRHLVTIGTDLAVAQTETTVAEFRLFIDDSGYEIPVGCWYHSAAQEWVLDESASWRSPGFAQTDDHPVSCLNWEDASAYANWLRDRTGAHYRLPSESEFEYLLRAGDNAGAESDPARLCQAVNGAGQETGLHYANRCADAYTHTSPVRSFGANAFGLYDTRGNLWEFMADCWNPDYAGSWRTLFTAAPSDGSAWMRGQCGLHVLRGGSFLSSPANLRIPRREPDSGRLRVNRSGIRVVREL